MEDYPLLLNREQASKILGIDPKSFDKYIRPNPKLKRFLIGKNERYLYKWLVEYIETFSIDYYTRKE